MGSGAPAGVHALSRFRRRHPRKPQVPTRKPHWYYFKQENPIVEGSTNKPTHTGQVLKRAGRTTSYSAGHTTKLTYNNRGQVLTMVDPRGCVTTNHYETNGYPTSVDSPLPGTSDTTTATSDLYRRVRTTTEESGYTLTFDYDTFDRLTKTTYPDGTFVTSTTGCSGW